MSFARHIRPTLSGEIPISLAIVRVLQRLRGFGGYVARVMTCSAFSGEIEGGHRRHHPHLQEELPEVPLRYPDRTFEGDLRIAVMPQVDRHPLNGHADGLCVVHQPEPRDLFASDLVFNGIQPYLRAADLDG